MVSIQMPGHCVASRIECHLVAFKIKQVFIEIRINAALIVCEVFLPVLELNHHFCLSLQTFSWTPVELYLGSLHDYAGELVTYRYHSTWKIYLVFEGFNGLILPPSFSFSKRAYDPHSLRAASRWGRGLMTASSTYLTSTSGGSVSW